MANYAVLKEAIDNAIKANGQREITGDILNQVLTAMVNSLGNNYQFAGVATPTTNPGQPDQNVFYLATQAGTYANFSAIVLQAGISILLWNGSWSSETFFTIDSTPTSESKNLITSGAVFDKFKADGGAYDVSAHNSGATFASLSALLNSDNLNTLIPVAVRHGGMSIKFVQSSDNKYVQYFLTKNVWSASEADWEKMNLEEEVSHLGQDVNSITAINKLTMVVGNITGSGTPFYNTARVRTTFIPSPFSLQISSDYKITTSARYIRKTNGEIEFDSLSYFDGSEANVHFNDGYLYVIVFGKLTGGSVDNTYNFETNGYEDVITSFSGSLNVVEENLIKNTNNIGVYKIANVSLQTIVWRKIFYNVNIKNGENFAFRLSSQSAQWSRVIIGSMSKRIKDWNPTNGELYYIDSSYDLTDFEIWINFTTLANVDIELYTNIMRNLLTLNNNVNKNSYSIAEQQKVLCQTNLFVRAGAGSVYIPMRETFVSGHRYRIIIDSQSASTLGSVFTSNDITLAGKVQDLSNFVFNSGVTHLEQEFVASGNAKYFHYYTQTSGTYDITILDIGVYKFYPANHWRGKKIVWLGTSVPFGAMAETSYPFIASNNLGFTLVQTAIPGMACHALYDSDSGLWYPMTYGSSCLSKAEYVAAKEAGLTTLEIPENPIIPYVPGGVSNLYYGCTDNIFSEDNADADLWVFDVTPNCNNFADTDWDAFNKVTWQYNSGTFADHRGTFLGAILYMMDKIYALNPNARMVLMLGSGINYAEGKTDFEKLANQWNIGVIDIQKKLNTSPLSIGKVYAWDVQQGTSHPSTFGQKILGNIVTQELLRFA